MMNKLTTKTLCTIALVSFAQGAFAENKLNTLSGAKTDPLTSEQVTAQQPKQFVVDQSSLSKSKSNKADTKNSDFEDENYNWVPRDWYSVY